LNNKSIRKRLPDRGAIYKKLRELPMGGLETITLSNGNEMFINPMKHFLMKKEYIHPELQTHLFRIIGRATLGRKKYDELEEQAKAAQFKGDIDG
jgi:hypothetical protein